MKTKCRKRIRSFTKGSFLTFPSLKQRNRFNIQLRFATRSNNGLLLYNGRFNDRHDFIALEIINGQLEFVFSLGSRITRAVVRLEHEVSDGEWHYVTVDYHNKVIFQKLQFYEVKKGYKFMFILNFRPLYYQWTTVTKH